jgi:predicted ester cyclase
MKNTSISTLFLLLLTFVFTGLNAQQELSMNASQTAISKGNKPAGADAEANVRAMLAAADQGNLEKFMSYWAPKFEVFFNGQLTSSDDMKKRVAAFRTGFPDVKRVIDEVIVNGNTVTVRGWMTGTNAGKFMGNEPTGKAIKAHLLCVFKLNGNGKIETGWVDTDMETLKSQLK